MKLNVTVSQLITFPQKLLPLTYLKLKNKIVFHCFLGVNGFVKIRITLPLLFFASFCWNTVFPLTTIQKMDRRKIDIFAKMVIVLSRPLAIFVKSFFFGTRKGRVHVRHLI